MNFSTWHNNVQDPNWNSKLGSKFFFNFTWNPFAMYTTKEHPFQTCAGKVCVNSLLKCANENNNKLCSEQQLNIWYHLHNISWHIYAMKYYEDNIKCYLLFAVRVIVNTNFSFYVKDNVFCVTCMLCSSKLFQIHCSKHVNFIMYVSWGSKCAPLKCTRLTPLCMGVPFKKIFTLEWQ